MKDIDKPWLNTMPEEQFGWMRDILGAPSPIGLEGAMTYGVLKPRFEKFMGKGWKIHQFRGNAGVVLDTHPGRDDMFSVMIIGHADKIRLQVRSIGDDGKIWIDSDSFLPTTLLGHEVLLFSEDPDSPGNYRILEGGTVEALGAIHFADAALRSGESGVKKEQLYLELQIHGEKKKEQIEALGIRPGDSIMLNRKIRRGFSPDTFYGAYLDNGLGCFVTAEVARLIAEE
ncbi:MAG: peptidase M42, partial [Bradymonadaceae bacterium]